MSSIKQFLLTVILFPMIINAQSTITLTLDDLIPGGKNYSKYSPKMPNRIQWTEDALTHTTKNAIAVFGSKDSIKIEDINSSLENNGIGTIKSINNISFLSEHTLQVKDRTRLEIVDLSKKHVVSQFFLNDSIQNIELAPNYSYMAYTIENSLYLQNGEKTQQLIEKSPQKGILFGQAVHRNEFGINKGIFWSPNSNKIAFYKMDETMVTDYPLVDISTRSAQLKGIKYPMAGMKSHQVKVGVYDVLSGKTVYLKTGLPKDKYLTNIAWSPDEKSIYIAELNRGQDSCYLKRYNAQNGAIETTLFEETHPKYVEPQSPVLFLENNPSQFLWQSRRDGYNHIYLYNTSGKLIKQITSGNWEVVSIVGFNPKGDKLYITSTEASPIEQHIYEVDLKTGKRVKLSEQEGVHRAILSPSKKEICDIYTSQHNPGKVAIINIAKRESKTVYEAKDPFEGINLPEISIGKLKANDSTSDLYYRITKPNNLDPTKTYPVIVYVYGGPHAQLVDNSWMAQARGWDIYMAQKGYIVFTLDNRGTPYRGADFENIIHRQLGVTETQDQMTGIDFLKSLPYVDQEKIGVHGWSFGGFMTLNLMLRHPEVFKVGVAGGPVTDWKYYEIMYGERYMDSPQENKEGYEETSMIKKAGNLEGRLLLIHGDEDPVVVMQHNLQFVKACVEAGTHPDLFIYPGHEHNVRGKDRVHLYEHITRYFEDFLK